MTGSKIKTFLFLILIFLSGCLVKRHIFHDPHFFYDKDNYTLIRVNPETRDEEIKRYNEGLKKTIVAYIPPKPDLDSISYDTPPRPKKIVKPVYSLEAKSMGYYGTVILKLLIDSTGVVCVAKPIFSNRIRKLDRIETKLVESVLIAAIQSEFIPAYHGEKPVPVWVSFPVRFVLEGNKKKRFSPSLVP